MMCKEAQAKEKNELELVDEFIGKIQKKKLNKVMKTLKRPIWIHLQILRS